MKTLFVLLFGIFCLNATAKDYYISNSGNDSNSGTVVSSPWQTLNKLNSFKDLSPGDNVYFKRGDSFVGSITANQSGTSGNPITFGAYGTGANPIITGFVTIDSWRNLGNNIWQSTNAVSARPNCNVVTINGVNTPMGRYPNAGFLTYQNSSSTSLTSSSLNASVNNWTGAQAVIKKERYIIDRNTITKASGNTINFTNSSWAVGHPDWGFFIQNDIRTLDQPNEWYYNGSDKKLTVYSLSEPKDVKLATRDTLAYVVNKTYIIFNGLSFTGSNGQAFYLGNVSNLKIQNCEFSFNYNGISGKQFGGSSSNLLINNCQFNHTNNSGIELPSEFAGAIITNNVIKNTGMIEGLAGSGQSRWGISLTGDNYLVQYNKVDSTGYVAIGLNGSNLLCKNNIVNYFCSITDDGGGIYTGNPQTGVVISDNIVLNGPGNDEGTNSTNNGKAHGIYCDDNSSGMTILNNSIANVIDAGIFLHQAKNIIVKSNTTYNCRVGLFVSADDNSKYTTGLDVRNNVFVANTVGSIYSPQNQVAIWLASYHADLPKFGKMDSNYYARPIDDNLTIMGTQYGVQDYKYALSDWQANTGFDLNSQKAPKTVSTSNDMRFEYNATSTKKTIILDANYVDISGKLQPVSVTLDPYSSKALIRHSEASNQAPVANAGKNKSITLPTSSVSVSGSGIDSDGTIKSYVWKKVSGPSSYKIVNPASASTDVTGLSQGLYQFELTVTDDKSSKGQDTVQITVNEAPNIAPSASAGNNRIITLPTSNVSLAGSGNDSDGTIKSYVWKKISGPSACIILSPTSANTDINGMTQGIYHFELTVTDNRDSTGKATVQVTVNEAPNKAPSANAGTNKTITLPTNSVSVAGSGIDSDGTIKSYVWKKISGPSACNILSPASANTDINGMTQGIYQFELTVTDNRDSTGKATVQVTVKEVPNKAPLANAGNDKSITLPTSSVSLSGSGIDSDGTINSYVWKKVSGPSSYKIVNSTSSSTDVNALSQGIYQFEMTVTDDKGSTGKATVQVTVIEAPNLSRPGSLLPAVNPSNTVHGLDFKYYEAGSYSSVPSFNGLTPVKTGTSNNFDISLANRSTAYSFNFTGYVDVPSDGQYTFYTTSDDGSNLYVDGVLVVNNDAIQAATERSGVIGLKAGKHAISVGYFQQNGGKILLASYSGPGVSKQIIPNSSLYRVSASSLLPAVNPSNTVNGIEYKYYEASSYSAVPSFSGLTPVKTGTSNNFDVSSANRSTAFSFNFTGYINVPADGQYTFYTTSDDGSTLYIDNVLVVNNDGLHSAREQSGVVGLQAGKHSISIGYFQQGWDNTLSASYAGPGVGKQVIPASALYILSQSGLLRALNPARLVNGLDYKYYEANSYNSVPSFNGLTPVKTGTSSAFDVSLANRSTAFSFNFSGYVDVPVDGQYTFYTTSDDGSNLYIDNVLVVDNDGLHSARERSGVIGLQAGKHAISVGYFQQGWDNTLSVSYAGPVTSKKSIPEQYLYRIQGAPFQRSINNLLTSHVKGDDNNSGSANELVNSSIQNLLIKADPNPFSSIIHVTITGISKNKFQLTLLNALGQEVWTKKTANISGVYTEVINASSLTKGVYFLRFIQDNKSHVLKLIKQ